MPLHTEQIFGQNPMKEMAVLGTGTPGWYARADGLASFIDGSEKKMSLMLESL